MDFEIYEGRTALNRKKTYLVFAYQLGYIKYREAEKASSRYFRCTADHVKISLGYIIKDELFLENPKKKPADAQIVRVAYWV